MILADGFVCMYACIFVSCFPTVTNIYLCHANASGSVCILGYDSHGVAEVESG